MVDTRLCVFSITRLQHDLSFPLPSVYFILPCTAFTLIMIIIIIMNHITFLEGVVARAQTDVVNQLIRRRLDLTWSARDKPLHSECLHLQNPSSSIIMWMYLNVWCWGVTCLKFDFCISNTAFYFPSCSNRSSSVQMHWLFSKFDLRCCFYNIDQTNLRFLRNQ